MLYLQLIAIVLLLIIFLQDIFYRAAYWMLFPVLAVDLTAIHFMVNKDVVFTTSAIAINMTFLLAQFILLSVYFSLRSKKRINITEELLGWGDILFLISSACYFSFLPFILFYIISLLAVLFFWVSLQALFSIKSKQVPLAGLQSLILSLILIADVHGLKSNLLQNFTDKWTF